MGMILLILSVLRIYFLSVQLTFSAFIQSMVSLSLKYKSVVSLLKIVTFVFFFSAHKIRPSEDNLTE